MALARWTGVVQDAGGNAIAGATIEVRNEVGGTLAPIYSDRDGLDALGNPFVADAATVFFHAAGGSYRVKATLGGFEREWRYVAIGTGGEHDQEYVFEQIDSLLQTAADGGDPESDTEIPTVARVSQLIAESASAEVATRTAMKALDPATYPTAWLMEAGREGTFLFMAGDYSKQVAFDTAEGVYIKADAIASTSGAWVRVFAEGISAKWFGAKGDNSTDDTAALQAWVDFHDQYLWKANFAATTPAGLLTTSTYLYLPAGIYRIDPTVGVRLWDNTEIRGAGTAAAMIKAHNTSAGHLIYRYYNGTSSGNGRVQHVRISGIRGIVTGADQVIFDLQHAGRCEVWDVRGGTQDRIDEFNNAKQQYWPGSALFKIGVGTSTGTGYVNGSDVMHLHHFTAAWLDFGVRGSASANQKQPEYLHLHDFEISDCHQSIVLNASPGMMGHVHDGLMQRWGSACIRADTGTAGADNYALDAVSNKYKYENFYFEADSTFAAAIQRSGNDNIWDTSSMNRYGTTTTLFTDSGTGTITR